MIPTDWQTIVHRAAFLPERVAGGFQRIDKSARFVNSDPLWIRWRDLLGGEAQLAERLSWLGLDAAQAQALLRPGLVAAWLEPDQLPPWAAVLADALAQSDSLAGDETAVITPFLSLAEPLAQPHFAWLSPAARQSLRDYLAERLRDWAAPTIQQVGAVSLPALCAAYPVLGRQLATAVLHWVDEIAAFNGRVAADWSQLTDLPLTAGAITAVQPNLSDPHNGGRAVWRVQLADGQTLAYKPKSIDLDHAWQQLVGWLNGRGLTPTLTPLWTLPRAEYGWMAWAEAGPSPSNDPLYDLRAGVLLGLFHLLHATDLHDENLIHGGAHPQLVDGEMLLYPQVAAQNDPLDLLRTGALPFWAITQEGVAEMGGLSGTITPAQQEAIGAGYARLMAFAAEHAAELWAADGPLASFGHGAARFTPRPTAAYLRLLDHLRHPAFLVSGAAFSVELDSLARAYFSSPEQKRLYSLLAAEQAAVSQGDVPIFTAPIGQPDLRHSHGAIPDFFVWPPISLPSPLQQAQQQRFIRASLNRAPYLPADAPQDLVGMARLLGELVAQQAVPVAGDGLGWVMLRPQAKVVFHRHALVGEDLYAGRAGIALFLAALGRVTGEARWRELALAGLRGGGAESTAELIDPGGRLYALALIADWLDAPHLIEEALALARQPHKLAGADLLDGQAGMALGLLKVRQAVGETAVQAQLLAQALRWGDKILPSWDKAPQRLGGFSHGAAGIAYSLTRLYQASGEVRFAAGAKQAWAFQQTLYDAQEGRWQDRRGEQPVYLDNWCHGSAGIGLAGAVVDGGETAVQIALNHLRQPAAYALDTLCCGRCGQIDALWELGEQAVAREMAQRLAAESTAAGYFQLYDDLPAHLFNPTFFRGVAGIGYTLLRIAHPLPCVLSMA